MILWKFLTIKIVVPIKLTVQLKIFKMQVIPIILSYIFISEIRAYTLTQIKGISDRVVTVDFDGDGNTYAVTTFPGNNVPTYFQVFKINHNEIMWWVDLPDYVEYVRQMLVSNRGDLYFDFAHGGGDNHTLAVKWANAAVISVIDQLWWQSFFLDGNDNLLYCKKNIGVHILRPDSSTPVAITNLENICIAQTDVYNIFGLDQSNNVYFKAVSPQYGNASIVLITEQSLQDEIPYATFINVLDNSQQNPVDLTVDGTNSLWITTLELAGDRPVKGTIKRLKDGAMETVLVDEQLPVTKLIPAEDKIFVIASDLNYLLSIYYITENDEIVGIPDLTNSTARGPFTNGITDAQGYAYFMTVGMFSSSLGPMVLLKPDEMTPIPVEFDSDVPIYSIKLDSKGDVWILRGAGLLFHLKKGETAAELVTNESCPYLDVNVNFVTGNVYASCSTGLYVVESN